MNTPSKKPTSTFFSVAVACLLLGLSPGSAGTLTAEPENELTLEVLFPNLLLRANVQETEPNDACPGENYTLLDVFHGSIDPTDDVDYVFFDCSAGQEIIIGTGPDPNGNLGVVDLRLVVSNFDCSVIFVMDDDSGPYEYAAIKNFIAPVSGTYTVKVEKGPNAGPAETGDYLLVANCRMPLEPDMCLTTLHDSQSQSVNVDINPFDEPDWEYTSPPIVFPPRPGFSIEDVIIDVDIEHGFLYDLLAELVHTSPSGTETRVRLLDQDFCAFNNLVHDGYTKYYFASNEPVNGVPRFLESVHDVCTGGNDDIPRGCYEVAPNSPVTLADLRALPADNSTWQLYLHQTDAGGGFLYSWSVHTLIGSQSELCPLDVSGAVPGQEVDVCLELRNYAGPLGSHQFDVQFDPNSLIFQEVVLAGITEGPGWTCNANVVQGDKVRVICTPSMPVDIDPDTRILLKLRFVVTATAQGQTSVETLEPMQGSLFGTAGCLGMVNVVGCLRDGDIDLSRTCGTDDYNCIGLCALSLEKEMPPECIFTSTGCETHAADVNGSGECDILEALWMNFRCLCDLPPLHAGMCQPGQDCSAHVLPPWDDPVNRPCPGGAGFVPAEGHEWLIQVEDGLHVGSGSGYLGLAFYDPSVPGAPDPADCVTAMPCQDPATLGFIAATAAVDCSGDPDALALANALAADINSNFPAGWTALVYDAPFDFDPDTGDVIPGFPHLQVRAPAPLEWGRVEACVFSDEIGGTAGNYYGHNLNERNGSCDVVSNLCDGTSSNEKFPYADGFQLSVDEGYWCRPPGCVQPLTGEPLVHDPIVSALRIPDVAVTAGDEIRIPVEIYGHGRMMAFQWDLVAPPQLDILAFEPSEPIADWTFASAGIAKGLARMGGFDTTGDVLDSESWTPIGAIRARAADVGGSGTFKLENPLRGFEGMGLFGGDVHVSAAEVTDIGLSVPRPNPSTSAVELVLTLDSGRNVTVKVFNVRGQVVSTVMDQVLGSGEHTVAWDGTDATGREVSSGTYFFQVNAGDFRATRKVIRQR